MQAKTTRAFRTISEAAEELDLQPHVLRFWESKFPHFKPIKRGGGRRFYRPEDIEFLRGIKVLLHDERHPIKDVQKLIRSKGIASIVTLGRSVEKAAVPKDVKDTVLVPERIRTNEDKAPLRVVKTIEPEVEEPRYDAELSYQEPASVPEPVPAGLDPRDREALEAHLERLLKLRQRWDDFTREAAS